MTPGEFIVQADHLVEEQVGAARTARASSPRPGPTRRFAPACSPTATPRSPSSATTMPRHHRHLVVLENTATVHNVICCTLCSCTAFTIVGLPPDWYKDLEYRARVVRESRTVLQEMGLDLPRRDRDPGLGHDRRHALHGAADAAAAHRRLERGAAGGDRHPRRADRRRAPVASPRSRWTASTTSAARRASAAVRHSPDAPAFHDAGRSASTRSIRSRSGSASSTWTSTAMRSSAWSRATTCRRATTSAR